MTFPLLCLVSNPPLQERSNLPNSPVEAFSLRRQLLIPYSNKWWVSFEFHSSRNDLKMCQRADIVENQRCGETSSSRAPFSFSWPIIKTLLKYQCPARNEHTSPQKWATDIKDIWAVHAFIIQWKKLSLVVMWFKVLVLSNVSGPEYIPWHWKWPSAAGTVALLLMSWDKCYFTHSLLGGFMYLCFIKEGRW